MKIKINTLDDLENFVSNENIRKENRFEVFKMFLRDYKITQIILSDNEQECNIISDMKQYISNLKNESNHILPILMVVNKRFDSDISTDN